MFGEFIRQPMLLHKGLWFTAIRLFCFRSGNRAHAADRLLANELAKFPMILLAHKGS